MRKKLFLTFCLTFCCVLSACTNDNLSSNSYISLPESNLSEISVFSNDPSLDTKSDNLSSIYSEPLNESPVSPVDSDNVYDQILISLEKDYEWYIDQSDTGTYYYENCGPTCGVMAAKWYNENFDISVESAREQFQPDGGGWFIMNIYDFLKNNKIPARFENFIENNDIEDISQKLLEILNNQNIIITLFDTQYITVNNDVNAETGKYFDESAMHFTVIMGAKMIDGKLYFEVYDPNSGKIIADDGKPVHQGRFYLAEELINASMFDGNNSQYIIVGED